MKNTVSNGIVNISQGIFAQAWSDRTRVNGFKHIEVDLGELLGRKFSL